MSVLKLLVAAGAAGMILMAFRDFERGGWLSPGRSGLLEEVETEPVLGYDGMDQETIIRWLTESDLDTDTLMRMQRYEMTHRDRGPVLAAISDLLE